MLGISPSSHAPAVAVSRAERPEVVGTRVVGTRRQHQRLQRRRRVSINLCVASGLAWRALQTHAMGDSPFVFGDWTSPPPPLAEFGADVA